MKTANHPQFDRFRFGVLFWVSAFAVSGGSLQAQTTRTKANNTDDLNLTTSWDLSVPVSGDVALWDSTVVGANTVSLGADLIFGTIQITNPGGPVTINGAGNSLTLVSNGIAGVGIDMSAATADLTFSDVDIIIPEGSIASTWNVAAGRTLRVLQDSTVFETENDLTTLTITGAGTTHISGNIGGDDMAITKTGTGTLILDGLVSTYTQATRVEQGVLNIRTSTALGSDSGGDNQDTFVSVGGELQLEGSFLGVGGGETLTLAGTGAGGTGSAALRNISGNHAWNGKVVLSDVAGVVRINSDLDTLTIAGDVSEAGGNDKILTFGGSGNIIVDGKIGGGDDVAVTKDGTGTLTLTGDNSFAGAAVITGGTVVLSGNGGISLLGFEEFAATAGITINNATLTLDNTGVIKNDRVGNRPITMNSGTFKFTHGSTAGPDYSERIDNTLTLNSGASTISTDFSNTGDKSLLRFKTLARVAGATVNFGGGTGNPSALNDDNNVRFDSQLAGLIGAWATVGGTTFATYNTASADDSVEALSTYEQTLTRLSVPGGKIINNVPADNVLITEGTSGPAGDITLQSPTTIINTLTNSATGGGVTIDPAGLTLQVNGILNAAGSSALTIGTGTNNGMLTAKTAGGELVLQNFSTDALTVKSVIADNSTASSLTKAGTGTLVATALNTYSGATFVNQGTLEVSGANGALANTSSVTVNTGGTLLLGSSTTALGGQVNDGAEVTLAGGMIQLGINALDETMGDLTLTSDSIIDFGTLSGINHLRFADSTGLWTSGTMLNILGYTAGSDHLYFGTVTNAGINTDQLAQINFYSGNSVGSGFLGTGSYLANGEVGLIPEPSSVVMVGSGLLALIGFRRRRPIETIPGN